MLYQLGQWWPLLILVLGGLYTWGAVRVKELAYQAAARRCQLEDVQLLDQSIALKSLKLRRGPSGSLGLQRQFAFEFTSTGTQRYQGWVIMQGQRCLSVELPPHRLQ
ncbi:MAG: DUF3301 domain-containing protein [Cellvibrionaceae bacterium]|nr:DUF3301 domain-containing protein [Cellvibrionaceae bacterium]